MPKMYPDHTHVPVHPNEPAPHIPGHPHEPAPHMAYPSSQGVYHHNQYATDQHENAGSSDSSVLSLLDNCCANQHCF